MTSSQLFHPLHSDCSLPSELNNPFGYVAHPLCLEAAREVRRYIEGDGELGPAAGEGKMFGVLVCTDGEGRVGFLAAFSGLLGGRGQWPGFVPPVYDLQRPGSYFKQEEALISQINSRLSDTMLTEAEREALYRERKSRSEALQRWLFGQYRLLNALGEELDVVAIWQLFYNRPALLRRYPMPPAGTGDCCAPKLLQQAYRMALTPRCIAEFWMGRSPRTEVRHDGVFYPACRGKCRPLLAHMLKGLTVAPEENALLTAAHNCSDAASADTACDTSGHRHAPITIVYEDSLLLVAEKPAGMLSVDGLSGEASLVAHLLAEGRHGQWLAACHRLDQATSGLLILAKDAATLKEMQRQFAEQQVHKRYEAIVEGHLPVGRQAIIDIPLRPDPMDRPRQVADREGGKRAVTRYEVVAHEGPNSRLWLWPFTGRTHQLRMHCALPDGLNAPILGDTLYGHPYGRLMLHAQWISFLHPETKQRMSFTSQYNLHYS